MITAIVILIIIFAIFGKNDSGNNNSGKNTPGNRSSRSGYSRTTLYSGRNSREPVLTKKEMKQIKRTIKRQQQEDELDMFATIEAFMDD